MESKEAEVKTDGITKKQEPRTVKTHRVGSVTLGLALVLFGILFLLHLFLPALNYQIIFHLWPCIFIMLGIEVLVGNGRGKDGFVYDKGAIGIIIILALFAMVMGAVDFGMEQCIRYQELYW